MSTVVDGFALLAGIGRKPDLFSSLANDVRKAALTLAKKFLKAKGLKLEDLRAFRDAAGPNAFALILESFTEDEMRTLTKKIDKHYAGIEDAKGQALRSHMLALASSEAELSPKPASSKNSKAPAPAKKKEAKAATAAEWPESMSAKPSRRR